MIKIIADSTCDLSEEIINEYEIDIVPLKVIIDGKSYRDGIDIKKDEYYDMLKSFKENPSTSMPSPDDYMEAFKRAKIHGYRQVICMCMSSGTSGSYQSAVLARNMFYEENTGEDEIEIYVFDSYSMSLGTGWLIMKTAKMIEEGFTFDEIIEYNEEYKTNMKHYLCVDDLDNLIKSGRISNTGAFLGKLIKIKPIMTMKDKRGVIETNERGRKRVISYYINQFKERVDLDETDFINIGYTDNIKLAENLKDAILDKTDFTGDIYIMQKGPSVGTHVGSGGLSMFYIEKPKDADHGLRGRLRKRKNQLKNLIK